MTLNIQLIVMSPVALRVHTAQCYYVGVTVAASVFPYFPSEAAPAFRQFPSFQDIPCKLFLSSGLVARQNPDTQKTVLEMNYLTALTGFLIYLE